MSHVIAQDAAVTMIVGTPFAIGAAPALGAGASIMGTLKRLSSTDEVDKVDVHGAGSQTVLNRYHSRKNTLTVDNFVLAAGYNYATLGTGTKVGCAIQLTVVPLSSLGTPDTYLGVITKWEADYESDTPTMEKIEIDLNPDWGTT